MKSFITFLKPSFFVNSILDIDECVINNPKIKVILLDVDNTIVPYKQIKIQNYIMQWLVSVSTHKTIVFITNSNKKRISSIKDLKTFNYICRACKPLPFCYYKAIKDYKVKKEEAIIIGDQLFDDILGGKLVRIDTILVKPIEVERTYRIRIKRYFELKILCKMETYNK